MLEAIIILMLFSYGAGFISYFVLRTAYKEVLRLQQEKKQQYTPQKDHVQANVTRRNVA